MYKTLFVVTSVVSLALYSGTQLYNTSPVQEDTTSLWAAWKAKQGKSYGTAEEDSYRYQVFLENYKFVKEYNARGRKAVMGLTPFADLTSEEFATFTGGLLPQPKLFEQTETVILDEINIPTSVDWVSQGAVTPIKNQGQCGSCWTFSTTGALEGLNFIKSGSLVSFSEQQILDCDKACQGCNGGIPAYAMMYTAAHGIEPSSDYPYTAQQGDCQYNQGEAMAVNKAYSSITAHSANALMAGIVQQPVSITVQANQQVFQMYTSGVITASDNCGAECDHAVLAVGYGTYGGQQAFMVKNSWGQSWGDEGYLYISTDGSANGGAGVCGILSTPVIPTA